MKSVSLLFFLLLVANSFSIAQSCYFIAKAIMAINDAAGSMVQTVKTTVTKVTTMITPSFLLKKPTAQNPSPNSPAKTNKPGSSGSSTSKPNAPPPPTSDTRPSLAPALPKKALNVQPKHLSRNVMGITRIKWNQISATDHYKVQVKDYYGEKTLTSLDVQKTVLEHEENIQFPGIYEITVSAFSTSGESNFITEETVHIVVTKIENPTMEIKQPSATGGEDPKVKKGNWALEFQQVTDAAKYTVVVVNDGKVVEVSGKTIDTVKVVTSTNTGRHDILLMAWKQNQGNTDLPLAWGKGSVIVYEDDA